MVRDAVEVLPHASVNDHDSVYDPPQEVCDPLMVPVIVSKRVLRNNVLCHYGERCGPYLDRGSRLLGHSLKREGPG